MATKIKFTALKSFFLLLMILANSGLWSQEEDLSISDVEVVKSFKAKLGQAEIVPNKPVIPDLDLPAPKYSYNLSIDPLDISYPDPIIRPLATKPELRQEPQMFWLKAGYGNLKRPEVDLGYNLYIEDLYTLSFWGSYNGGKNDVPRSYSTTDLNLDGALKINSLLAVTGGINYLNDQRNLFNSDSLSFTQEEDLDRSFSNIGMHGGIKSNQFLKDRIAFNAEVILDYNTIKQYDSRKEFMFAVPASLTITLNENNLFSLLNRLESSSSNFYDNRFSNDLRGALKSKAGFLSFDIGGSLLVANKETHLFPAARISYSKSDNFVLYLGADQDYTRNNMAGLYGRNVYVNDSIADNSLSIEKSIFVGSEGQISKFSYTFQAGYLIYDRLVDFNITAGNDQRFFTPAYYDGNAISIEASGIYRLNSWMETGFQIHKLFYDLDISDSFADINLPDLEGQVHYRIFNKSIWQIKASFNYRRYAFNNTIGVITEAVKLNNLVDFSVYGDYFFHKNAGIYLSLNNISGQNYERWYNYPDFGFNLYGGVKLKF